VSNMPTSSSYWYFSVAVLLIWLSQDDLSVLFSRYAQAMLKKISNGTASPGMSGSTADSPEHNCLSWLAPSGRLQGPNRDYTRPLRSMMTKAVEKYATQIDYAASAWSGKRRSVKVALKKGLRTRCNRRRNSARLLAYRTLGVYMDDDVQEAFMERVVLAPDFVGASNNGAQDENAGVGYRPRIKDGPIELVRALDMNGAAAAIIAELLLLDFSEVWTFVLAAGAACLQSYVDACNFPKFLRPESNEARKGVVRCMRDELKDLKAGDLDLSDEEADSLTLVALFEASPMSSTGLAWTTIPVAAGEHIFFLLLSWHL